MRFVDRSHTRPVFENKRVAIVGGGPGVLANNPGFIDSHDVVVRMNNYRLFAESDMLHMISAGMHLTDSDPFRLFEQLLLFVELGLLLLPPWQR